MKFRSFTFISNMLSALLIMLTLLSCNKKDIKEGEEDPNRPKVGLVLGGGGAKCSTQIGVLRELEKMGIKIDCIAGSSMGAVIGSLYAAGYTPDEIEDFMLHEKWMKIFDKDSINKWKLFTDNSEDSYHWSGLIRRPYFRDSLYSKMEQKNCRVFEKLKIPFCCTATWVSEYDDSLYIFNKGVVANAVTASMSHPIYATPWYHEGMALYDGGIVNNLPIDVVREMSPKPDFIIAIDVENDSNILNNEVPVDELISIVSSVTNLPILELLPMLLHKIPYIAPIMNWVDSRPDEELRHGFIKEAETDNSLIYIHVNLDGCDISDFNRCEYMIQEGENAVKEHQTELNKILK